MAAGHRKRTTARVLQAQNVYVHDLLEVLLFKSCPRKDLYDCTTTLLNTFGSLKGVLSADINSLTAVEGVGENVAEYLRVLGIGLTRLHGVYSFGLVRSSAEFYSLVRSQNKGAEDDLLELYAVDKDGRVRMIIPISGSERSRGGILKRLLPAKTYGVFALRCNGGINFDEAEERLVNTVHVACTAASVKLYDYCVMQKSGFYSCFVHEKISGDRV